MIRERWATFQFQAEICCQALSSRHPTRCTDLVGGRTQTSHLGRAMWGHGPPGLSANVVRNWLMKGPSQQVRLDFIIQNKTSVSDMGYR